MEGSGKMLVLAVGVNSQNGRTMVLCGVSKEEKKTKKEGDDEKLSYYKK